MVASQAEIICDGGIRRGSDIIKALALGARACMIGRAYLYGLGAAGERGVDSVLGLLADDMRRTMAPSAAARSRNLTRTSCGGETMAHEWCTYAELDGIGIHQLISDSDGDDAVTTARLA